MNAQLKEVLKAFKWSDYEMEVYATLVEKGAMHPPDLVTEIDIPSGRVYDVLNKLEHKGAVVQIKSSPSIYDAQNPRMVLQTLIGDLDKKIEKALRTIEPAWERRVGAFNKEILSWSVKGERSIKTQLRSLINKTEKSLLVCDANIAWMGRKDIKEIRSLSDAKKEVKIISSKNVQDELENLASLGINVMIGKDISSYYLFDKKIVLLKMSDNLSASIIKDEKFVTNMLKQFTQDSKSAKPVKVKEVVG